MLIVNAKPQEYLIILKLCHSICHIWSSKQYWQCFNGYFFWRHVKMLLYHEWVVASCEYPSFNLFKFVFYLILFHTQTFQTNILFYEYSKSINLNLQNQLPLFSPSTSPTYLYNWLDKINHSSDHHWSFIPMKHI